MQKFRSFGLQPCHIQYQSPYTEEYLLCLFVFVYLQIRHKAQYFHGDNFEPAVIT